MPVSMTQKRCVSSSRRSDSGTPMWLFKLPVVLWVRPCCASTEATISLVVVLPFDPATATNTVWVERRRCACANACSASNVSSTTTSSGAEVCARAAAKAITRHDRAGGAVIDRRFDEIMTVETLALQSHI